MQSKDKNNKTICTENKIDEIVPLPAHTVADIAGCSESFVKKIRSGKRKNDTPKAQVVAATDELWQHGSNKLVQEIKRIVKL